MKKLVISFTLVVVMLLVVSNSALAYSDTEHWAKYYIEYVTQEGYFVGTSSTTFDPCSSMTRGMFVTALSRYDNTDLSSYSITPFTDIANSTYYTSSVLWAYDNKIVQGTSDSTFSPSNNITREEVAVIINNYLSYKNSIPISICSEDATYFNDINKVSSWALIAVKNMKNFKIFIGDNNNNFNPNDNITRAECAVVFSRLDNKDFEMYKPPEVQAVSYEVGLASAYSECLVGGATATGERLSGTDYTVAVPISQYNTYKNRHVEILYNGISIIARCNDCGGFAKYGRSLDLSPGIYKAFGFTSSDSWGVRSVQYRWID